MRTPACPFLMNAPASREPHGAVVECRRLRAENYVGFPNRGARHGLEVLGRQRHLKEQSAAICPVYQGALSRNG